MEKIIMKHPDGTTYTLTDRAKPSAVTSAEQRMVLLGEDTVSITVETAEPLPTAIGDTAVIFGKTYTINKLPQIHKTGDRRLQYTITMEGPQYKLLDVQFILQAAGMSDSYTGNLAAHMGELVACLNRRYGTASVPNPWAFNIAEGIGAEFKTFDFGGKNCLEALQTLCQDYGTEFQMTTQQGVTTIAVGTAGQVITGLGTFEYGKGGGLYELNRSNVDSSDIVTRLYVFGSTQNLPKPYPYKRLLITGATSRANSYIEDAQAIQNYGIKENTINLDDIMPKLEEHNAITALGAGTNAEQYFVVSDFPFDVNAAMIAGTSPTITMQTGHLAGYKFELVSYDNATKTFRVKPYEDENKLKVPSADNASFQFSLGDTFLIGDITMPTALVDAARAKLTTKGTEELNSRKHPKVAYSLQLDSIRLRRQMSGQAGTVEVFHPGDYIQVQDTALGIDGNIRITAFSRDILHPYAYKLTLGDGSVQATVMTRIISDLQKQNDIIRINQLQDPTRKHNAWRTTQELMDMIFDTDGYFENHIRPKSIETQMLEVGARSQQLMLSGVAIEPNYDSLASKIYMSAGAVTSLAMEDAPRTWNLSAQTQTDLDASKAYYLYIKAQTAAESTTAQYLISDQKFKAYDETQDAAHYYFLLGTLSTPKTDAQGTTYRILSLTYGETTINGRYIKTGRIMDSTGGTFIDLDENKLRLGTQDHCIDFNNLEQNGFILKGVKLKSIGGATSPLTCYRGAYSAYETYYFGDEVSYTTGGETATYRCNDQSAAGIIGINPTDATKWLPVAVGKQGIPGAASSGIAHIREVYANSASSTSQPTTGWSQTIPTYDANKPYLWNALEILTTDAGATPTYHDIECLGEGISSIRERYARTTAATAPAHSTLAEVESAPWQDDMPSLDPTYRWMWNLEIMEYLDGRAKTWTNPSMISHYGKDGQDGLGIENIVEVYGNSASETIAPADNEWRTTIPAHENQKPYLWNAIRITYEDSRGIQYTDKQCMGQGVRSVKEYYKTTTTATAPTTPSPSSMTGWSRTMPDVDSTNRWLWNVELISYYDSRTDICTQPSCIAHYGRDGDSGRAISDVVEQYAIGTSTQATGQWQDNTIPTATQQNPYIWNREKITYSQGDPSYTAAQRMGKDVDTITEQYAVSSSGTEAPTSGWGSYAQVQAQLTKGKYLWNREVISYTNGYLPTTTTPTCIGYQGHDGDNGKDATELGSNLLMDANFQEGRANGIAEDQGWWRMDGTKTTGVDGKQAMSYDNTEGTAMADFLNQLLFKVGRCRRIEPSTWYTLSFWAKGTQVDTYLYGTTGMQVVDTTQNVIIDGTATSGNVDGHYAWTLDPNTWVMHTYTFKTKSTVISDEFEKKILFRVFIGHQAQICMPKLERGLTATAFCLNPEETSERATSYMGAWDAGKTYTGTGQIRQCVKYSNSYYMTMRTAGNITGSSLAPNNSWYWREFDAVFENVATGLLLAEEAVIENAVVRKLQTSDGTGADKKRVQVTGNQLEAYDTTGNLKTKISGEEISSATDTTEHTVTGTRLQPGMNPINYEGWREWEQEFTLATFNVSATNNVVSFPAIRNRANLVSYRATTTVRMQIWLDETLIREHQGWYDGTFYPEHSEFNDDYTIPARTLSVGQHTLKMKYIYGAGSYQGYTGWFQQDFYTSLVTAGTKIRVQYVSEMVEIGANGYKAIFGDSDHQVIFVRDPQNNAITLQVRNGNSGIEFAGGNTYMWYGNTKYRLTRSSDGTVKLVTS